MSDPVVNGLQIRTTSSVHLDIVESFILTEDFLELNPSIPEHHSHELGIQFFFQGLSRPKELLSLIGSDRTRHIQCIHEMSQTVLPSTLGELSLQTQTIPYLTTRGTHERPLAARQRINQPLFEDLFVGGFFDEHLFSLGANQSVFTTRTTAGRLHGSLSGYLITQSVIFFLLIFHRVPGSLKSLFDQVFNLIFRRGSRNRFVGTGVLFPLFVDLHVDLFSSHALVGWVTARVDTTEVGVLMDREAIFLKCQVDDVIPGDIIGVWVQPLTPFQVVQDEVPDLMGHNSFLLFRD